MSIGIGKSGAISLAVQRNLAQATADVSKRFERLSSGLRINKASDDAAGLSIASQLESGRRITNVAVRNINDGISLTSIADSALSSLGDIVGRLSELANQASNGGLTNDQRKALDTEAQALSSEYSRIVQTSSFNGKNLFDGSLGQLSIQTGPGASGKITGTLGGAVGDGTFAARQVYAAGVRPRGLTTKDLNMDGYDDILISETGGAPQGFLTMLSNGDGTFGQARSHSIPGASWIADVQVADFNNDGIYDLAGVASTSGQGVYILMGTTTGDYTPGFSVNFPTPAAAQPGDFNGDGNMDFLTGSATTGTMTTYLGDGKGNFSVGSSFAAGIVGGGNVRLADFDNDGALDAAYTIIGSDQLGVALGNGDGSFQTPTVYAGGDSIYALEFADVDQNGTLDIVTADSIDGTVSVYKGNSDGTFASRTTTVTGAGARDLTLADFNGDGIIDVATANSVAGQVGVLLGNGKGAFNPAVGYSVGTGGRFVSAGDFNGDGVYDLVTADYSDATVSVLMGRTRSGVGGLRQFSLETMADAREAGAKFKLTLDNISKQRADIGSLQARYAHAESYASVTAVNYAAAASRIKDIDVAHEAGKMISAQIRQQAATAIVAQANQSSAVVLNLLSF